MAIEVTSLQRERGTFFKTRGRLFFKKRSRPGLPRKRRRILRVVFLLFLLALAIIISLLASSYVSYSKIVDMRLANGYLTSRAGIYAAPRTLRAGQMLSLAGFVELMRHAGYMETEASDVWSGSFTYNENSVDIRPRQIGTRHTPAVNIAFTNDNRIARITSDGATIDTYALEPEVLTNDFSMKTGSRAALSFKEIPTTLVQAILSIEDHRFFEHRGVDVFGIGRAILRNVSDDSIGQGGSTITQQLIKNTYLTPERTFRRKYAEAMLAFTLERRLSKEDIFALYCNEVYLGQRGGIGLRGVKQAARVYFGKELKDLTLAECATIAGMIQGPNRYSPVRHGEAAAARRTVVIDAMLAAGLISNEQATAGVNEQLTVVALSDDSNAIAPYFVDYVNRVVESKLGSSNPSYEREARIYTTIDLELQGIAEVAIKHQLEILDKSYPDIKARPQAALVALDPRTGNVLAMVGGRGYQESQLNRATDALRQPGSVFKPFVYAAALETGLSPISLYKDAPQEFVYDRTAKYRPANYGGGYSMRDVTLRDALVRSLNVVTVDVAMRTGLKRVARYAEDFGLPRPLPFPSLALGTTEATPLELASAYTAFANAGVRVEPNVIAHVTDASGASLVDDAPRAHSVVEPATAYMITDMLSDVIDHGTARAARGSVKKTAIAGKTGTSHDGWFVGYTPNLVVAVWIGFDDNKQLGLTGAKAALPAWTEFVRQAVESRPELGGSSFPSPDGIMNVEIDPQTGGLASTSCPRRERVALTLEFAPNVECFVHADYSVAAANIVEAKSNRIPNNERSYSQQLIRASSLTTTIEESKKSISPYTTHVTTDDRGHSVLINLMRINGSAQPVQSHVQ